MKSEVYKKPHNGENCGGDSSVVKIPFRAVFKYPTLDVVHVDTDLAEDSVLCVH